MRTLNYICLRESFIGLTFYYHQSQLWRATSAICTIVHAVTNSKSIEHAKSLNVHSWEGDEQTASGFLRNPARTQQVTVSLTTSMIPYLNRNPNSVSLLVEIAAGRGDGAAAGEPPSNGGYSDESSPASVSMPQLPAEHMYRPSAATASMRNI